jgi:hypothetical protein
MKSRIVGEMDASCCLRTRSPRMKTVMLPIDSKTHSSSDSEYIQTISSSIPGSSDAEIM